MKITEEKVTPSSLFCHYGQTDDIIPFGDLVSLDETPITTILRYLRELAGFRLARNFPIFLCNVIGGYKEHEPIIISLYMCDVLHSNLKYRNSGYAFKLRNKVISSIAKASP